MIGDGNAKDVATEILDQFLWAIDGSLDVDFPILGQGVLEHGGNVECAIVGIEFAFCPKLGEGEAKTVAELVGKELDGKEEFARSGLPAIAPRMRHQRTARDDEMDMKMVLHGLSPGMQDHGKTDLPAEILVPELLQQLGSRFNEEIEQKFLVERHQRIEDMIDGKDDMIIVDGQQPFLLFFQPLRLFKGTTLWTMAVLAGFVVELPLLTNRTFLHHAAHRRRAAIDNRAHGFGLFIGKPMSALVFADVFAEDVSHIEMRTFGSQTVSIWRQLYLGSCSLGSISLTTF